MLGEITADGVFFFLIPNNPHIGSTAGVTTAGSSAIYSASKAGLIQTTKVWATGLAEFGVRVNCISPGSVATPIFWRGYSHTVARGYRLRGGVPGE